MTFWVMELSLFFSNFNYQCVKEVKIVSLVKNWYLRATSQRLTCGLAQVQSEASQRKPTRQGCKNFCFFVEDAHQLTS